MGGFYALCSALGRRYSDSHHHHSVAYHRSCLIDGSNRADRFLENHVRQRVVTCAAVILNIDQHLVA